METTELQIFEGKSIPAKLVERYKELPSELQAMSEEDLRKAYKYSYIDNKIRLNLWKAVADNLSNGKPVVMKEIYDGVCSRNNYYKMMTDDKRVAFLMIPVSTYEEKAETLLEVASARYMEILNMDITQMKKVPVSMDDEGKVKYDLKEVVDPFRAKLLLDTVSNLENRVKGSSIQKNITIHDSKPKDAEVSTFDVSAISGRIKEIESQLESSNINDPTICVDVEYKEIENDK